MKRAIIIHGNGCSLRWLKKSQRNASAINTKQRTVRYVPSTLYDANWQKWVTFSSEGAIRFFCFQLLCSRTGDLPLRLFLLCGQRNRSWVFCRSREGSRPVSAGNMTDPLNFYACMPSILTSFIRNSSRCNRDYCFLCPPKIAPWAALRIVGKANGKIRRIT